MIVCERVLLKSQQEKAEMEKEASGTGEVVKDPQEDIRHIMEPYDPQTHKAKVPSKAKKDPKDQKTSQAPIDIMGAGEEPKEEKEKEGGRDAPNNQKGTKRLKDMTKEEQEEVLKNARLKFFGTTSNVVTLEQYKPQPLEEKQEAKKNHKENSKDKTPVSASLVSGPTSSLGSPVHSSSNSEEKKKPAKGILKRQSPSNPNEKKRAQQIKWKEDLEQVYEIPDNSSVKMTARRKPKKHRESTETFKGLEFLEREKQKKERKKEKREALEKAKAKNAPKKPDENVLVLNDPNPNSTQEEQKEIVELPPVSPVVFIFS